MTIKKGHIPFYVAFVWIESMYIVYYMQFKTMQQHIKKNRRVKFLW